MHCIVAQVITSLRILQSTGPSLVPMNMDTIHSQSRGYEWMMSMVTNMAGSNALPPSPLVPSNAPGGSASKSQAHFMGFTFPNDNNYTYNTSATANNHTFSDSNFRFFPPLSDNFIKGSSGEMSHF